MPAEMREKGKTLPHNAMRHSFGSYFLGKTKDEKLTACEMGNSADVVVRHYRALVKDADVAAYWDITPETIGPIEFAKNTKLKTGTV